MTGPAALWLLAAAAWGGAAQDVADFALFGRDGAFHQLSRYADRDAVVLCRLPADAERARRWLEVLERAAATHAGRDLATLLLEVPSTPAAERAPTSFPVLLDEAGLVAETLGLWPEGQALIVDPSRAQLWFRGSLGDGEERGAFERVLRTRLEPESRQVDDEAVRILPASAPLPAATAISYADEIAPLLARRCAGCHVRDGVAPFAMDRHESVRGWSRMIEQVVMTKRMPPGQLAPPLRARFEGLHGLTPEEERLLVHWVRAGAPRDENRPDPLRGLPEASHGWSLGEPDLVLEFPPHDVPASGLVEYILEPFAVGNERDLWVRALQFQPGAPQNLHHLIAYMGDENGAAEMDGETPLLGGYSPGKFEAQLLPAGTGRLLPAGATLLLQFHYTTNGKPTTDRTRLGLYLHDEPPPRRLMTFRAWNGRFRIPPHARMHPVGAWTPPFPHDVLVHSFTPHMHMRGTCMRYRARLPDGSWRELFAVANYDFNWQFKYRLREPIRLPAGTALRVEGAFDNSIHNPFNPDPSKEIQWGRRSIDEMFIGYFNYTLVGPPGG